MTNHIDIRNKRADVLNQYEGIQVGRNGILGDYINSITSINTWLDFLNNAITEEKFEEYRSYLSELLKDIENYEDWGLFHRRLGTLEGNSIYETPELYSILFKEGDVEVIIEAINKNVHEFQQIGSHLDSLSQEEWETQGEEISKWISSLVEKQNKLITLGLQDEVIESVDDVAKQVFDIMHLAGVEFQEINDRGSSHHMMADANISNAVLSDFGIQVGDTIAREAGENTFEYTVKGVGYFKNHLPYPNNRDEAEGKFKEALKNRNMARLVLCFSDEKHPDKHHMIRLFGVDSQDKAGGIFTVDDGALTYMKI